MYLGDLIRFMNSDLEEFGHTKKFPILVPDIEDDFLSICKFCCTEWKCEECVFGDYIDELL